MQRIVLDEPSRCGLSVSEQLQNNGVRIGDSNFREAYKTIFQLFARYASSYYELVEQRECLDDADRKCGLCGNLELLTYYTVQRVCEKPLVTTHAGQFEFDFELEWPRQINLGSHCVKLIGIPMVIPKMFNSMFYGHPSFKLTDGGLIRVGTVIANYDKWAYDQMAIPHSVFTRLPLEVMREFNLRLWLVNNPMYPDECSQKSIQRSLNALGTTAKYGRRLLITSHNNDEDWWRTDEAYDNLVTVVSRRKAEQIYNKYRKKKVEQ